MKWTVGPPNVDIQFEFSDETTAHCRLCRCTVC